MLLNKTVNEAFEVILKQALTDDIEREFQELEIIENIPYSYNYKKIINKIHNIYKIKSKKNMIIKILPKIILSAASAIIIISLSVNPHVQAFAKTIFERIFGQYTHHEFYSSVLINKDNFNYDLKPQYIPDSYKISQINYMTSYVLLNYENEDNAIKIKYAIANETDFAVDNEHSIKHDILINNNLAIFYESTDNLNSSYLIWVQNGYCFMITAQVEADEFVKIAESIKIE